MDASEFHSYLCNFFALKKFYMTLQLLSIIWVIMRMLISTLMARNFEN